MRSKAGIAAQAVGVAALGAVVYFAFLHPGDSGPLSGIEVEDGIGLEPPQQTSNGRRGQAQPTETKTKVRRPVTSIPIEPQAPISVVEAETPTGSQYQGVVARILGQVSRADH